MRGRNRHASEPMLGYALCQILPSSAVRSLAACTLKGTKLRNFGAELRGRSSMQQLKQGTRSGVGNQYSLRTDSLKAKAKALKLSQVSFRVGPVSVPS